MSENWKDLHKEYCELEQELREHIKPSGGDPMSALEDYYYSIMPPDYALELAKQLRKFALSQLMLEKQREKVEPVPLYGPGC